MNDKKYCSKCNSELKENETTCTNCNTLVKGMKIPFWMYIGVGIIIILTLLIIIVAVSKNKNELTSEETMSDEKKVEVIDKSEPSDDALVEEKAAEIIKDFDERKDNEEALNNELYQLTSSEVIDLSSISDMNSITHLEISYCSELSDISDIVK